MLASVMLASAGKTSWPPPSPLAIESFSLSSFIGSGSATDASTGSGVSMMGKVACGGSICGIGSSGGGAIATATGLLTTIFVQARAFRLSAERERERERDLDREREREREREERLEREELE